MESIAKKLITNPCLIAADVDNTLLKQGCSNERSDFIRDVAPELVKAANNGTNLAVITGNSFKELSTRFLKYLITYIEDNSDIELLSQFHFFCNSGGIHFHLGGDTLKKLGKGSLVENIFYKNSFLIKPEFIDWEYLNKTRIINSDIVEIERILTEEWDIYIEDLRANLGDYQEEYFINKIPGKNCDSLKYPIEKVTESYSPVDMRYLNYDGDLKSTVQITLKPVLTWKHAIDPKGKINNDKRSEIINRINEKLDQAGLSKYSARPGGTSSIDITKSKLDKSYAVRYLIDYLGIDGNERKGEKYGSNVLYLGDEVISGGGNDYPVTKIEGVLVFALNKFPEFVIFKSRVIVPSGLTGPDAAAFILSEYNNAVRKELNIWSDKIKEGHFPFKNAIQVFKENWFIERIKEKINNPTFCKTNLSTEELQVLYTFVTLIFRNDDSAKKWTNLLVNELDMIMEALDENETERLSGIGSSYPTE